MTKMRADLTSPKYTPEKLFWGRFMDEKICSKCGEKRLKSFFYGKAAECKKCWAERVRLYNERKPEILKKTKKKWNEKVHPPIECKICGTIFKRKSASSVCSLKCRILDGCKEEKNGCWIWQKCRGRQSYGKTGWFSKAVTAHRASYIAFKGEIPEGLQVCHKCDVRLCVNPDHLWLGTQKDNMEDAKTKGRLKGTPGIKWTDQQREKILKNRQPPNKKGEAHHLAKLNEKNVREIRNLLREGIKQNKIADKYGVCQSAVSHIKSGRRWPHILEEEK
ncbi:MAG: hypothetical protein K940chlam3_00132 [Chlamydiae bacterium]|nr:hypothetical protein [Chlamydiota bacterium]